jgi:Beta/Gamma crystallin
MAEAPPAPPSTTGVGPASEPAVASPESGAVPATGCELLIYSEANFKGLSAPVDENQTSLSEDGWQNEIASLQIKSGTWDFYSDEAYAGEMMRLSAGSYPTLDPKWNKHIGSFMCSAPAK